MTLGHFYKSKFTSLLVLCTALNKNVSYLFEGTVIVVDENYTPGQVKTGWINEQFEEVQDVKISY